MCSHLARGKKKQRQALVSRAEAAKGEKGRNASRNTSSRKGDHRTWSVHRPKASGCWHHKKGRRRRSHYFLYVRSERRTCAICHFAKKKKNCGPSPRLRGGGGKKPFSFDTHREGRKRGHIRIKKKAGLLGTSPIDRVTGKGEAHPRSSALNVLGRKGKSFTSSRGGREERPGKIRSLPRKRGEISRFSITNFKGGKASLDAVSRHFRKKKGQRDVKLEASHLQQEKGWTCVDKNETTEKVHLKRADAWRTL